MSKVCRFWRRSRLCTSLRNKHRNGFLGVLVTLTPTPTPTFTTTFTQLRSVSLTPTSAETKEIRESFTKTERLLYLILMIKHGSKSADSGGGIGYVPSFETNIEMDSWEYLSRSHLRLRLRLRQRLHNYAQSLTPTLTPTSAETKEIRESFTKQCV
ncbi:hypothetical protein RclHR1_00490026 [Rhizophagus clarus]|uniref:Uncharacterized protein n=1 Tax=Rhizophagus clarus TaxID=94130 RepID=A0A2Z6S1D9_9GLOM|nr:hypothetical protein RclHR1_00490026 [Rhizophagus clarus]